MPRWSVNAATATLSARDPALAGIVAAAGPMRLRPPERGTHAHFRYLARSVVFQQLAGSAARAIHERVVDALGGTVTPGGVLAAGDDRLRSAGLSAAKARTIRSLAEAVDGGDLDLDGIARRPDAHVVDALSTVWGIGRWTAEMFLLFQLRRPDVWPTGDLGVRRGFARMHGLERDPTPVELEVAGDAYRPFRSVAAWYCWRAVDVVVPDT